MFEKTLFGSRLFQLRSEKKLTQQELADIAGLKKTAISMIESGQRAASIEVMYAFADYFNVSLDYLCGRTDKPEVNK